MELQIGFDLMRSDILSKYGKEYAYAFSLSNYNKATRGKDV